MRNEKRERRVSAVWRGINVLLMIAPWTSGAAQKVDQKTAPSRIIAVFKADGSVQCKSGKGISLESMTKQLKSLGATVLFATTRELPMAVPTECGTPTGKVNYFEIGVNEFAAYYRDLGKPGAFAPWEFDAPTRVVFKYDGAVRCKTIGIRGDSVRALLKGAGVVPLVGFIAPRSSAMSGCFMTDGDTFYFRMPASQASAAIRAGFQESATRSSEDCRDVVAPVEGSTEWDVMTVARMWGADIVDFDVLRELGDRTLHILSLINRDGSIGEVKLDLALSEKGTKGFLASARKSRFLPAVYQGCYVTTWGNQKLTFKMQ